MPEDRSTLYGLHVKIWAWEDAPKKFKALATPTHFLHTYPLYVVKIPRQIRHKLPTCFWYYTPAEERKLHPNDVEDNRYRLDRVWGVGELHHLKNGDAVIIWGEDRDAV